MVFVPNWCMFVVVVVLVKIKVVPISEQYLLFPNWASSADALCDHRITIPYEGVGKSN